jgi:hypothetical protein
MWTSVSPCKAVLGLLAAAEASGTGGGSLGAAAAGGPYGGGGYGQRALPEVATALR